MPNRKGEHPRGHLSVFQGTLRADGYAGFEQIYAAGKIQEAACWAHYAGSSTTCKRRTARRWQARR
jgi:Transposase IS66 family